MADQNFTTSGVTRVTLTNGSQRNPKRIGISYDYMDKLNGYIKAGIFVDKNNDGFTKSEQKALGEEFAKLHSERNDKLDFRKMKTGDYQDYKDEEFLRLAKAAGYVLADDKKEVDNKVENISKAEEEVTPQEQKAKITEAQTQEAISTPKIEPMTSTPKEQAPNPTPKEELTTSAPVEKASTPKVGLTTSTPIEQAPNPTPVSTLSQSDEISNLAKELTSMKANWSEEELRHPAETLRNKYNKISSEISQLKKDYTMQVVTKKNLFRTKTEKVKVPKTEEQLAVDNQKAKEKAEELDHMAKLMAVERLYAYSSPTKFAANEGDMPITRIVTTKDGRKLAQVDTYKNVFDKEYGIERRQLVTEYYDLSLRNFNENKPELEPQYYYRVVAGAKPVTGEISE